MCASWGVSSSCESTLRLRTVSPVSDQLVPRPLGETLDPHRSQHLVGGAKLRARVDSVGCFAGATRRTTDAASERRTDRRSAQVIDGVAVTLLGGNTFGEQRFRPALNAKRPLAAARSRGILQALECRRARGSLSAARRSLDELVHVDGRVERPRGLDRFRRGGKRGLVLPEAVVEDCGRPQDAREPEPVTRAGARNLVLDHARRALGALQTGVNGDTRRIKRVASGRVENLRRLGERGCGGVEVAFEEQHMRKRVESERKHRERTELTRRLDVENRELADGLEIPQQHRRAELLTEPMSDLGEDRVIDRRLQRPSQRRRREGRPVDGVLGVADEEPLLGRVRAAAADTPARPRTSHGG